MGLRASSKERAGAPSDTLGRFRDTQKMRRERGFEISLARTAGRYALSSPSLGPGTRLAHNLH